MYNSNSLITLSHVNQGFSTGEDEVKILHDVNISIPEGSFSIVYGSSGSGKSTLLNVITGLQEPINGQVLFLGNDLFTQTVDQRSVTRAQTLGMVYQANYWIKSLSVLENVAIPLYFLGYKKADANKKALISLDRIGIAEHANRHPGMLSGGEQQRVSMARALVNDPPIIIADEPTGNLDSQNSDIIIKLLKRYQKESGRTVVLVTHELEFLPLGTHLFRIQDGVVTAVQGDDVQTSAHKLIESMKTRIDDLANSDED